MCDVLVFCLREEKIIIKETLYFLAALRCDLNINKGEKREKKGTHWLVGLFISCNEWRFWIWISIKNVEMCNQWMIFYICLCDEFTQWFGWEITIFFLSFCFSIVVVLRHENINNYINCLPKYSLKLSKSNGKQFACIDDCCFSHRRENVFCEKCVSLSFVSCFSISQLTVWLNWGRLWCESIALTLNRCNSMTLCNVWIAS